LRVAIDKKFDPKNSRKNAQISITPSHPKRNKDRLEAHEGQAVKILLNCICVDEGARQTRLAIRLQDIFLKEHGKP